MASNNTIERRSQERNVDVCKRLLTKGGYLLIVGGGVGDLNLDHPQLIIWDDQKQSHEHKVVPSNTRGIVYSLWSSHSTVRRLRIAANKLGIPLFPMQKVREIRELVEELLDKEHPVPTTPELPGVILEVDEPKKEEVASLIIAEPSVTHTIGEDMALRAPLKNEMLSIMHKHRDHFDGEGMLSDAVKQFIPVLKKEYGIGMSEGAIAQAWYKYVRHGDAPIPKPGENISKTSKASRTGEYKKPVEKKEEEAIEKRGMVDEFEEAEKLLRDTKASIDLLLDFIPKIRKKVASIEKRQNKLRELLGDD